MLFSLREYRLTMSRSIIKLEVRNTAEEKPEGEGYVYAFDNDTGQWNYVMASVVRNTFRRITRWIPRNLDESTTPAYYSTAQRMPTEADGDGFGRVLVCRAGCAHWIVTPVIDVSLDEFKYWQPMPDAPISEKTECEKAFEAKTSWITGATSETADVRKEAFQAGYEAAIKETR